ncbi:dehydration-responsive element-binding protein 2A-like [Corylus avellana]|uniref:dehydration-responsive element-binding protein 2A-like n=1 Tax=Corylus avellana TaxID=13451 RepID=UPI00286AAB44|nr:dehydration-responsive element-binding protein 2A-like [Corylus avellana]
MKSCNNEIKLVRKALGIWSKKGCMKENGGLENSSYKYKGIRQRTRGRCVVEICKPKGKMLCLVSFENVVDAALSYDKAERTIYDSRARLNFLDDCSATTPSSICLAAILRSSGCTNYFEDISMKLVTPNLKNENGKDEWSSNTLHAAEIEAATVATLSSTQ